MSCAPSACTYAKHPAMSPEVNAQRARPDRSEAGQPRGQMLPEL